MRSSGTYSMKRPTGMVCSLVSSSHLIQQEPEAAGINPTSKHTSFES